MYRGERKRREGEIDTQRQRVWKNRQKDRERKIVENYGGRRESMREYARERERERERARDE